MNTVGIGIVGCGFVADYYMGTKYAYPHLNIRGVYDIDKKRLQDFCNFYSLHAVDSVEDLLNDPDIQIIVNLTNPSAHFFVSKQALAAGKHVYSEKPLAMGFDDAQALVTEANSKNLIISSAPCNALSKAATAFKQAVETRAVGDIRLVYAELEDGFVPIMPYKKWVSASGARWPYRDEFEVGCTLEHSGYYLGWLVAAFGDIETVTAFSSMRIPNKIGNEMPLDPTDTADMSVGILKFRNGVVVRLSTTIIAERDYSLRAFGDNGVIRVEDCWDNGGDVTVQQYIHIRRRTLLNPLKKKIKPTQALPVHKMRGSKTRMDFLLGIDDLAKAIQTGQQPFLSSQRSLHINEAALALQYAGESAGTYRMKSDLTKTNIGIDLP